MKTAIIIQARIGSTRLPNKIMLNIEGKPVLWHVIQRVKKSKQANEIIIATSNEKESNPIEEFCKKEKIKCYRGNLTDVLERYYKVTKLSKANIIVRITSDSPLNDPFLIDKLIKLIKTKKYDYVSNCQPPWMDGFDVEVFTFKSLEDAWKNAKMASEREHVTPYIRNSKKFKIHNISTEKALANIHCSIDKKEDLEFVRAIYKILLHEGKDHTFTYKDVVNVLKKNPHLLEMNKGHPINEGYYKSLREDKEVDFDKPTNIVDKATHFINNKKVR